MGKTPHQILKKYWGFNHFKPNQLSIINEALSNNDILGLLPTGGGKTLCYQIPALIKPGICLVISPLVALMQDQVNNLRKKGIKAELITGSSSHKHIDIAFDNCRFGKSKFIYLSPEKLQSFYIQERIKHVSLNYIAVDEAHCISQWGHDFRPAYRKVNLIRDLFPKTAVIAVTATATKKVANDIQIQLNFPKRNVVKSKSDRPNIKFSCFRTENKTDRIKEFVYKQEGSGIVYIRSRKIAEQLSKTLNATGIQSSYYHAGISIADRKKIENDWKENKIKVIVATNAFGMGIDKHDVRFVLHYGMPNSLEEYIQEAGRAGRDNNPAEAILFYNKNDIMNCKSMLAFRFPSLKTIQNVYQQIGNYAQIALGGGENEGIELDLKAFAEKIEVHPLLIHYSIKILENAGYVYTSDEVNSSSTVQVLQSRHEIENVINQQKFQGQLLSLLLRSYTGLFNKSCNISESELAAHLACDVNKIKRGLKILEQTHIIKYTEQVFKPKVFFATPRLSSKYLLIPKELLKERQTVATKQLNAMVKYATEENSCRTNIALFYFDEQPVSNCGHCDNCNSLNNTESEHLYLQKILSFQPKNLNAILLESELDSKATIKGIRRLIDEGIATNDENGVRLLKK